MDSMEVLRVSMKRARDEYNGVPLDQTVDVRADSIVVRVGSTVV